MSTITKNPVYAELERETLHFIESYRGDLTEVDRETIEDHPGMPFLHATRTRGTHLIEMPSASDYPAKGEFVPYCLGTENRERILECKTHYFEAIRADKSVKIWHYFDGTRLIRIEPEAAQKLLVRYSKAIREEWYR